MLNSLNQHFADMKSATSFANAVKDANKNSFNNWK